MDSTCVTQIFDSRAQDYQLGRPGYPIESVDWLESVVGAPMGRHLADVGCGTGLLAHEFLARGFHVMGIEPNAAMRANAIDQVVQSSNFAWSDGTAEATKLADASVNGIVVGTAFHWFDPVATKLEFRRVLHPDGWVALFGCERDEQDDTDIAFSELLGKFRGAAHERMRCLADCAPLEFLGTQTQHRKFFYPVTLGVANFRALAFSRSYMPDQASPRRAEAESDVGVCFYQHEKNGVVKLNYYATVYIGLNFSHCTK